MRLDETLLIDMIIAAHPRAIDSTEARRLADKAPHTFWATCIAARTHAQQVESCELFAQWIADNDHSSETIG